MRRFITIAFRICFAECQ